MRIVLISEHLDLARAEALAASGHAVTLITSWRDPLAPRRRFGDVRGVRIRMGASRRDVRNVAAWIDEEQPDLVLASGCLAAAAQGHAVMAGIEYGEDALAAHTLRADMERAALIREPTVRDMRPPLWTWVIYDMGIGGTQQAVWRYVRALPPWLRERAQILVQRWPQGRWNLVDAIERELDEPPAIVRLYDRASTHVTCIYGRLLPEDERAAITDPSVRHDAIIANQHAGDHGRVYPPACRWGRCMPASEGILSNPDMDRWMAGQSDEPPVVVSPPMMRPSRISGRAPITDGGRIRAVYVGRISPDKGGGCIPSILAADPEIEITLYSGVDDSYHESVMTWQTGATARLLGECSRLGVHDRLHIKGFDITTDYARMFSDHDVFVATSPTEGFCLSLVEALACGLPAAVTRGANAIGLIEEGKTGALYDFDDSDGKSTGRADVDWRRMGRDAAAAIRRAAACASEPCVSAVEPFMVDGGWPEKFGRRLLDVEGLLPDPSRDDPRVTVMLRYHHGCDRLSWLDAAMFSITRQTYRDFKVVLCFDGLPDQAQEVADRYGGIDWVCSGEPANQEHMGWAFRQCIEQSTSEYVKPLDYDDVLMPDYLARSVEAADEHGLDLWSCRMLVAWPDDDQGFRLEPGEWPRLPVESIAAHSTIPHCTALMRRASLLAAGSYGTARLKPGDDDQETFRRLYKAGGRLHRDDDYHGAIYRVHPGQVTRKMNGDRS